MSVGYYTVGDKIFYSKTAALIEATKSKLHPQWHFGDAEFGAVDFSAPTQDVRALYKKRAIQLREKYDYLILNFSGGADSSTILRTFVQSKIHLDEILVKWPVKATSELYKFDTNDTRSENILSEWDACIKPVLEHIATHCPKTKITVYDFSDGFETELVEDDWLCVNDHLNPGVFRRFGLALTDTQRKLQDAGKRVAMIWGIDKPQLAYKDNAIYLYFLDKLANTSGVTGSANRINELFYWTPDMPEIAVHQAKKVYEHFVMNPQLIPLINWTDHNGKNKKEYDTIVKHLVYPDWDLNTFQAKKPTSIVNNEYDWWMFKLLQDYRYLQSWRHGLNSIKNAIDSKYYQQSKTGAFDGWVGFISPFYKLGPVYPKMEV